MNTPATNPREPENTQHTTTANTVANTGASSVTEAPMNTDDTETTGNAEGITGAHEAGSRDEVTNAVYVPRPDSAATPADIPTPRHGQPVNTPGTGHDVQAKVFEAELVDDDGDGLPDRFADTDATVRPVDPAPRKQPSRWETARNATRTPVVPEWAKDKAEVIARARWAAAHAGHTSAFHALRVPKYAATLALRSPRGLGRTVASVQRWVFDAEGKPLRANAVAHTDSDTYLKLAQVRQDRVRKRLGVALLALVGLVLLAVIIALSSALVQVVAILAALGVFGALGSPKDKPLIGRAVITQKAQRLTSDVVVRALGALGIAQINQAMVKGPGITFPAPITRDGPGWRAEIDLPYGVTVADIVDRRDRLASGLRRPLGCVWPEPVHEEHAGRLVLWVGDQDMAKTKPAAWPLAKTGKADLFRAVPFGTDQRGRPVGVDLMESNVLIGAMPGAGKTFALRVLLLAAALDPSAQLWLFELKGSGDLSAFETIAHRYASGPDDDTIGHTLETLRAVYAELMRRIKTIGKLPKSVCPENKVTPELAKQRSLGLFPLVVAIDECQNLFSHETHGKEAGKLATDVIKLGRAFGVILLLATQRPDKDSLPTGVSANVGIRFCLKVMGQTENDMILGTSMYKNGVRASMFTRHDKGIGYLVGASDEPQIARSYYIDGPQSEAIVTRARQLREQAGTITGHAAGDDTTDHGPSIDLLADLLTVLGDDDKVWSEVLVDRLAALRPEVYGSWAQQKPAAKATQLAAALKAFGITTEQVYGQTGEGKPANRRGVIREHVEAIYHARPTTHDHNAG